VLLSDFLTSALPRIPTLVGAKFTSFDNADLLNSISLDKKLHIFPGFEMAFLSSLPYGCKGQLKKERERERKERERERERERVREREREFVSEWVCSEFIGISFNVLGPLFNAMIRSYDDGDMEKARALQRECCEFFRVIEKYGYIQSHKVLLKQRGIDLGPVRPPLLPLMKEEEEMLHRLRGLTVSFFSVK
jgi:dihydrodipicolinate synthase/N-acetylneuraminate lyase